MFQCEVSQKELNIRRNKSLTKRKDIDDKTLENVYFELILPQTPITQEGMNLQK